ncbi:patatin-like phospholipase family protein [Longimicrobium sp.]|uniref:patatin-like phospholipase family protein n=1 Tax=Longimicrobium sp. TaxID=2029185 RepID=UPI002C003F57|nr:patatin-like phospholipase family protein [Longimicrobium sp.]HSU13351.1 patatin-like phospholipase family protein [Longimicrobium sp.]
MPDPTPHSPPAPALAQGTTDRGDLALVLTGGGARGAYQVGILRYISRRWPEMSFPIITGVSAGAINAAHLAQAHGTLPQAVDELAALWSELTPDRIFRVDVSGLLANMGRWGLQLAGGGMRESRVRGLVDTAPLGELLAEALAPVNGELTKIDYNLARGTLRAVALGTTSYSTGQSVIWVQGRDLQTWERPSRRAIATKLRVEHVMASSALPLFFPAVQIGDQWHGDGGIRLTAPLSPALHLGAHKILAISTHYERDEAEASRPTVRGYPPPAQVIGLLMDAIFLDVVDQDVMRMERMNHLLRAVPPERREGMRVVELMTFRPSRDLGAISREHEPRLPRAFRLLTRGLGTRETSSPDALSLMMFQDDYIRRLIEIGEEDAERRGDELAEFIEGNGGE